MFESSSYKKRERMRGQTYSILGPASILKEKESENLTCSWTQAAPKYQEGPHDLTLAHTSDIFPSYFLATVNQRLVWLFQMYFGTICDRSWSCFRAPTFQLTIVIQLDACQARHLLACSPFPIKPCPTESLKLIHQVIRMCQGQQRVNPTLNL